MKTFFSLILFFFLTSVSFSQTVGKSKIVMKDKAVINDVKIWNIYSNKIEYEEKESLHDLLTDKIARIETDTAVLSFGEDGQLFSRPYDLIIKSNGDTVECIISQLGGNYVYYYSKGKENRSYIPESSIKKYQVFNPEPIQKLEIGSEPYSPQVSVQDSLSGIEAGNKTNPLVMGSDSVPAFSDTTEVIKWESYSQINEDKQVENKNKDEQYNSLFTPPNDFCYESYLKGEKAANLKNESFWGAGSFCLSGCFGALPVSAFSLIALNSNQRPKKIPEGVDEKCYSLGYQNQQTKKRVYNTAMGGLISSAILIGIIVIAISSQNGM